jgi:F1F0 ATPase subunit 2
MNELLYMILSYIAGMALGLFFFGGLWFTVKKAVVAKTPAIWFLGSFILRVSVVMLGFYFISPGGWQLLLISVVGFIVARFLVIYFSKSMYGKQTKEEVYNEA